MECTYSEGIQKGDGRGEAKDDADDGGDTGRRGAQRSAAHGMAGTTGVCGAEGRGAVWRDIVCCAAVRVMWWGCGAV